jgi:CheY-like chemotaxis protein
MAGRILVLDDEENYAEMLQDLLREHGYRVDIATRPERAIAQLEEIPYDLVISDYKMPVFDGADLLKKSRELYPSLPFILVSGLMNTPELVKVANMSVTLVMEKPLDTQAFLDQVARFSSPLTEEEREQLAREGKVGACQATAPGFPSEPRFFSAHNPSASRFLQALWSAVQKGWEFYILEPRGSDAELVLKDLSNWRGYADRPIADFDLPGSTEDGLRIIGEVLADAEKSRVVTFRLESIAQIAKARELTSAARESLSDSGHLVLAYRLSGCAEQAVEFKKLTGKQGAVLPEMRLRPSDVAAYSRRFARIATDRSAKKSSAEFTPELGLALLTYGWPNNYTEIKTVVQKAVQLSGDAPISLEVFQEALGREIPLATEDPLASLLRAQQAQFLQDRMAEEELSLADLSDELDLPSPMATIKEIGDLPLQSNKVGQW